jgi:acid phosphatase (class A)
MAIARTAALALALPATIALAASPADDAMKSARSSLGSGYLAPASVPDSLILLPLPPAAGSAAQARDEEAQVAALVLRGTARWDMATADAELIPPTSTGAMSCAAGFAIGETETPAIQKILRRATAQVYAAAPLHGEQPAELHPRLGGGFAQGRILPFWP